MNFQYVGSELELFSQAVQWKAYLRDTIAPYLGQEILEVGAGIGTTTIALHPRECKHWLCLEPDPSLQSDLMANVRNAELQNCEFVTGVLADLSPELRFDTILYIDVLEHIEADRDEVSRAVDRLKPGGYLVVLSPAHQFLYSPFDRAIGHYRRYSRRMLCCLTPKNALFYRVMYLDSIGLLASLSNRLFLKQAMPSLAQVKFWDRFMIPISRIVDRLTLFTIGKSILAVWRKL